MGLTSSDTSILQIGLKLPLAHFRNHAAHVHPSLSSLSATTCLLELAYVSRTLFHPFYDSEKTCLP